MQGVNAEGVRFKELEWNWKKHKPQYYFPALKDLTIQQTPNTTRTCYMCRGLKFVAINHTSGKITARSCMRCHGIGSVYD